MRGGRTAGAGVLLAGLVVLVGWVSPDPRTLGPMLSHPQAYLDRVGSDRAAVTLVAVICWLVLGWLLLAVSATAAGSLPGVLGTIARAVSGRLVPATLRRATVLALGLSVATGGASAAAASGHPPNGRPDRVVSVSSGLAQPTRATARIDVDWPVGSTSAPAPARRTVIVAPGECLWDLAATRLGRDATNAQIAAEWQRWYAANRSVIGPDPDLIHPGQRLVSPEPHRPDRTEQR